METEYEMSSLTGLMRRDLIQLYITSEYGLCLILMPFANISSRTKCKSLTLDHILFVVCQNSGLRQVHRVMRALSYDLL